MSRPQILVDADACPVVRLAEDAARRFSLPMIILCDEHHLLHSDYAQVRHVSSGADAVDIALINLCRKGDIVLTQDYGVAAMVLGRGAFAMHHSGMRYTDDNMDRLLMERHTAGKMRRASGKHHLHGPAKFTQKDRERFAAEFEKLILIAIQTAGGNIH